MAPLSDEALFERFRVRGDADALGELFDRAAPALLRIALHLTRDPSAAEDLVQATFLKAIEARTEWEGRRAVMPWLCGILQNRARSARKVQERAPDPSRLSLASSVDPARAAEAAEFDGAVDAAIAALPEPYQAVLRLHLAYGHVPGEIAHALSRPPGTVRSQLARGLELLRRSLPAGLTGVVAASLLAGRGLAAVRECVLVQAAAATPVAPFAGAITVGAVAMKAVVSTLALLAVAALAWFTWPRSSSPVSPEVERAGEAERTAAIPERGDLEAAPVEESPSRRVALASSSSTDTGALSITCLWGDDGSPAAGVMLTVSPWPRPDGGLLSRTVLTAEDGRVLLTDLPAWDVFVSADRGGQSRVEIVAGATTETELTIPAGIHVRGRVVDERGVPVTNARVWLSAERRNYADGRCLAVVDTEGRFDLRSVEPERFLGAVAPGRRAAVPQPIRGEVGSTAEVELVLNGPGTALLGRVVDPSGAPVIDARVRVGRRDMEMAWNPRDHADYRPPLALETDLHGEFRADGLAGGTKTELWVRARGFCTWFEQVRLETDFDTAVEVRLQRGATVTGKAIDTQEQPVAGVYVSARSTSHGPGPGWTECCAITRADGTYEIAALPPGTLLLTATTEDREVRGDIVTIEGETVTWNPVLAECVISGRVVDARGTPLVGWKVSGQAPREKGRLTGDTTDGEGRFRWERCTNVAYRLDAHAGNDDVRARAFTMLGLRPGPLEVLVQIPDEAIPTASIEGKLLDVDARPIEQAEVRFAGEGLFYQPFVDADPDTGRFRVAPLPPGTYRLQGILTNGGVDRRSSWSEPFTLAANEHKDVGLVPMPVPGSVFATVRGADGMPLDGGDVALAESFGWGETFWGAGKTDGGTVRIVDMAPGTYRLRIGGRGLPNVYQAVVVAAGRETRAEVSVPAGIRCRLVHLPAIEPAPLHLTFAWSRDGEPWEHYVNWWESDGEISWSRTLLPGDYEVTITSETGNSEVNRFVVHSSDPPDREVRIRLP